MKMTNKIAAAGFGLLFTGTSVFAQSLDDAKKAIDAEQYQKAKSMLKNLTVTESTKDENFFYLGWVYLKQDYADSAKAVFTKGIAVNPKSALNYAGLGRGVRMLKKIIQQPQPTLTQQYRLPVKRMVRPFQYIGLAYLLPISGQAVGPNGSAVSPADANCRNSGFEPGQSGRSAQYRRVDRFRRC